MAKEEPFSDADYPSIDLAYEIVLPSYDWAIRRLQVVEQRIEGLLRLTTTATIAIPVIAFATTKDVDPTVYLNWQAVVASALFFLTTVLGLLARRFGGISVIDPKQLYDNHLKKGKRELKKDLIYFAGLDFQDNVRLIERKSRCADLLVVLFVLELVFGVWWLVSVHS